MTIHLTTIFCKHIGQPCEDMFFEIEVGNYLLNTGNNTVNYTILADGGRNSHRRNLCIIYKNLPLLFYVVLFF